MTGSEPVSEKPSGTPLPEGNVVQRVVDRATALATERKGEPVSTADLLVAVFKEYGRLMDRALYLRGATREELLERIAEMAEHASAER